MIPKDIKIFITKSIVWYVFFPKISRTILAPKNHFTKFIYLKKNKLAKARKMRKPPGTKAWTQNTYKLATHFWKFFGQQSFLGQTSFLGQKKIWVKKVFRIEKVFWVIKFYRSKKVFGSKTFLGQKIIGVLYLQLFTYGDQRRWQIGNPKVWPTDGRTHGYG